MAVKWSAQAKRDLTGIWEYYSVQNEKAAIKIMQHVHAAVLRIDVTPQIAPIELKLEHLPGGFRSIVVRRRYKIVYLIKGGNVHIDAIWDCRMNPASLINRIEKS